MENNYNLECKKYFEETEALVEKLRPELTSKKINNGLIRDIETGAVNSIKEKLGTLEGLSEKTLREIKLAASRVRAYNCYVQAKEGAECGQKIVVENRTKEIEGLSAEGVPTDCLIKNIRNTRKIRPSIDELFDATLDYSNKK